MFERDYTSKQDNFLKHILELRKLVRRILHNRERLKADFVHLHKIVDVLSKDTERYHAQQKQVSNQFLMEKFKKSKMT